MYTNKNQSTYYLITLDAYTCTSILYSGNS